MKIFKTLLVAFLLMTSTTVASAANEEVFISYEDHQNLYNVSDEKMEIFKYKIENNITLDSDKETALSEFFGEEGIEVSADELMNGVTHKIKIFEDGSVIEMKIEKEMPLITPFATTSDSYGTTFRDHKISLAKNGLSSSFYFSGRATREGYGSSSITDVHSPSISGFGVSNPPSVYIHRAQSNDKQAALAIMSWMVTSHVNAGWGGFSYGVPIGTSCFLYLALIRGSMYVSDKHP